MSSSSENNKQGEPEGGKVRLSSNFIKKNKEDQKHHNMSENSYNKELDHPFQESIRRK